MQKIVGEMGQSPSSIRSKGSRKSFRGFVRRSKFNKSSLSHTFNLPPSEEYPELMNINTATEEQLMTLPGVSRQLAREIVRHRQMIGRFKRVDDLALVSGIGAEKLELLRPEICTNMKRQESRASSCTHSLDSFRLSMETKLCSVNSSSVFQLQCIPGLNQELAANIVDYRDKKGPFKSLDDLIKVRGIDIIRLSAVKPHLSLDLRKSESEQNLPNGHANGWTETSMNGSLISSELKTPASPSRKSFTLPVKFPLTLPNGFAAAPVNDILDLLSAYSHRPVVREDFLYERDGVRCCRLASWNIHQLTVEKVINPGVREVVCRTILENKLSVIAIQDVIETDAVKIICEELNAPTIRRVREWKLNSHNWEYCIPQSADCRSLCFIYENSNGNNRSVTIEDVAMDQLHLVVDCDVKSLVVLLDDLRSDRLATCTQAFLICGRPIILVNVHCKETLDEEDCRRLKELVDTATAAKLQLALMGEFLTWKNVQSLGNCESLVNEGARTTVDIKAKGKSTVLCAGSKEKSNFNGHSGIVKSGLCHLAIPRGWSWGGAASPYCPVWTEIKVFD